MDEYEYRDIFGALSDPRFRKYLEAAGGDPQAGLALYHWNLEVAAAFYPLLHWVEIGWRNAIHRELGQHFGRPDWWVAAPLDANGRNKVKRAQEQLARRKRIDCTPDDLVTEFSFGFWVSLLSRGDGYDRALWVPALHKAFPYFRGRRRELHVEVLLVLYFRNRVMHYEPVFNADLARYRETILRLLRYVSPVLLGLACAVDRVPDVLARRPR